MATMKAVQVMGGAVELADVPRPTPRPGEALIKVLRAGICNTDIEIINGYMGFQGIIGHEFVGAVVELSKEIDPESDEQSRIMIGQRVVGEINLACYECDTCKQGGIYQRNHCEQRTVLGILAKNGTFAEYVTLPIKNLFPVPDSVPSAVAVFVEPLAAAYRILEQITFKPEYSVAVIGDGKLGLLIAKVIANVNAKLHFLFGKHQEKLAMTPTTMSKEIVNESTKSEFADKFDITIEASGTPSGVMLAASITKPLGTLVLKTTCAAGASDFNTAPFVIKELLVVGSRCGNFPMALQALRDNKVEVSSMITKEYAFSDAIDAIKHAQKKGTLKIQLVMDAS